MQTTNQREISHWRQWCDVYERIEGLSWFATMAISGVWKRSPHASLYGRSSVRAPYWNEAE
ncbi:hypothetical protein [Noviherbaspirillum malthae]|uniref:hypothetical protein n=1 Tax=Noviherbaspirillum malthae TaxID=1260987 RepID=UPI0018905FB4|nr:hypothetical protein [Noviherbaspirillum malthae]